MTPAPSPITLTLTLTQPFEGSPVWLELVASDPDSQASVAPVRGPTRLDRGALRALQLQPERYGQTLTAQLFDDPDLKAHFIRVQSGADLAGRPLRLSVQIDPSALDLQALRWELLRHPESGALLAASERLWFSRFMVSTDWRPVHLRARGELRAVVAVAAPPAEALARAGLAPVDIAGEVARAQAALVGVPLTVVGQDSPCTLDALVAAAREADLLTLVCHGAFHARTGSPVLYLQDASGRLAPTPGEALAEQLAALRQGPRLVVLASCQSAGTGQQVDPSAPGGVTSTLAALLANAGVPAVLAMQGQITMSTVEEFMPVFWQELLSDGQIDRAVGAARCVTRSRPDAWMPALFLRLTKGRIWYTPGFSGDDAEVWRDLAPAVSEGRVVPLIGPGVLEHICGSSFSVARNLAEKVGFPLPAYEWDDLPRVTQYMMIRKKGRFNVLQAWQAQMLEDAKLLHRDRFTPDELARARLAPLLNEIARRARAAEPDEPFGLLARLRAPVYLTTNPDNLLMEALRETGQQPIRRLTRWRVGKAPEPEELEALSPHRDAPLVFHALGAFSKDGDESVVLTEDDHFDYLISTASDRLMPDVVDSALVDNALLFLGFRLTDWSFRVLFRLLMSLPGRQRQKKESFCHVAVQVDPDLHDMADVEGARRYLAEYFKGEAQINLYWGTPREFLAQLHQELARTRPTAAAPETAIDDDEWE